MSYESPNIVIVPTTLLTNKNIDTKLAQNMSSSNSTPTNTNASKSMPQINKCQDTAKSAVKQRANQTPNLKTAHQETVPKSNADQIEASKNVNLEVSKNLKNPSVSSFSKYKQSDRECSNSEPIKANLPSVPNDGLTNQIVHHTWKNKCEQKISINLLPRPTFLNTIADAMLNTPNFSDGVNPMSTTWNPSSQSEIPTNHWTNPLLLHTPTNLNMNYGHCVGNPFNSLSPLQNPTNISTDFTTPWTYPALLETTPHLNIGSTPYATWPCTPQMQTSTRSYTGTTLTYPSQFQADTAQSISCYPCMDTETICPPPVLPITPNLTDFTTHRDTITWQIQESHERTINRPIDTNNYNNSTATLIREQEITSSRIASRGTSSPSFKSRMDYTWLTRAHYANINQPNKKPSKDKPVSVSKNKEKQVGKTTKTSVAKEKVLLSGSGNKLRSSNSHSTKYYNEKRKRTDTYAKNHSSIKDSASSNKCKNEEMREKERKRNKIKEEIKILETTIKNINSNKKIPISTYSKKDSVGSHKTETTFLINQTKNKTAAKDNLSDKSDNEKIHTPQKRKPSRVPNFKKRIYYSSEDSEPEQKRSRRKIDTKINKQHSRENEKHSDNKKKKNVDVGRIEKIHSKTLKTHGSEKNHRKRKSQDSSSDSLPKKRYLRESENMHNIANSNNLKSVVTPAKLSVKHPRIHAPVSTDSDDSTEPDFDLRSKLSRKNYNHYTRDKTSNEGKIIGNAENLRENLLITVYPNDDNKKTTASSKTEPSVSKQKTKKYKKIRLVINVIQEDTSDDSSSEVSKDDSPTGVIDNCANLKSDLSFLDDINIDEIVNSLKTNSESDNVHQQRNIQKVENSNVDPQTQTPRNESVTKTFVQPIIIKKETTAHIDSQIHPQPKLNSSAESITKTFVQPIIIKKEIVIDNNIVPQIQTEQKVEKAKTLPITNKFLQPIRIKKEIFEEYLDPQIQSQQNIEATKSSTESIPNKFVQPIILKKEVTESTDPQIQPDVKNSEERTHDNVKISEYLNNNTLKQHPGNILNAVNQIRKDLLRNIKQENEDQTEINTDDSSSDTLRLQTSLSEDDLLIIDELSDTNVENMQSFTNNFSAPENILRIKFEPHNSYEQDELQNVLNAEKNIPNDVSSKEPKGLELRQTSESDKIFGESNKRIDEILPIENNKVVSSNTEKCVNIKELSIIETIQHAVKDKSHENKFEHKNNSAKPTIVFEENCESKMMRMIHGPMDVNKLKNNHAVENPYQQHTSENHTLVTFSTSIKDSYELTHNSVEVDNTRSEQSIILTEPTIQPKGDKLEFIDKEKSISNETKTLNVDATKTLKLKKQATESESVVTIEKNNCTAIKTVNVEDPIETLKLKKQALECQPVVIIEKIDCYGFKTVKLDTTEKLKLKIQCLENKPQVAIEKNKGDETNTVNVEDATDTVKLRKQAEDKTAANVLVKHDITNCKNKESTENIELHNNSKVGTKLETINDVVKTSNEIEIERLQKKGDPNKTIEIKVTEQAPLSELGPNTSDVTTETNNKETLEKIKHQKIANSDPRTATITHPEQKSKTDLVVKIEDTLLNCMKQKFDVMSKLNTGKFSNVFVCKDTNNKEYALKILHDKYDSKRFGVEKQEMLQMLQNDIPKDNSNIVFLVNGFSLDRTWCFLMEHYPLTLKWALRNTVFYMDTIQELAKQLVAAVLVIRSYNIVHSDIKPGHILLNSSHTKLKVCGFDAAYYVDDKIDVLPNIGTTSYRAPEVILGYSAGYSIDVWATGVVLYEMATGSKLLPAIYNNDALFKQMCLFGRMPMIMMLNSRFSHKHFNRTVFKRFIGPHGEHILYYTNNILSKKRMYDLLVDCTMQRWHKATPFSKRVKDKAKLGQMSRLLDKMFVLDPNQRLPIEYVFSDPFFMYS